MRHTAVSGIGCDEHMVRQQAPLHVRSLRPPTLQIDGSFQVRTGLAVGWSVAMRASGRARDRLAAREAAARAVARVTGCAEDAVTLSHRAGAAPVALHFRGDSAEPLPCALSIAHSGGQAVAAAAATATAWRVGVDVERAGTVSPQQVRVFASCTERALGIDPTVLWTLKEAAWKACSCASSMPFQALRVEFVAASYGLTSVVFSVREQSVRASACIWHPWRGWIATLVAVA